jgi:hypothetical protein
VFLQSKKLQLLSKSSAFCNANFMIGENSFWCYYLKGLCQVFQFRFLFIKNVNLKQKIKEHFSCRLSEGSIEL